MTPALDTLERMARARPALMPPLDAARTRLAGREAAALEAWGRAGLDLLNVNAGITCLIAFWQMSSAESLEEDAETGLHAADICRHAGAAAALAVLKAAPVLSARAGDGRAAAFRASLTDLAYRAPDCVAPFAGHAGRILAALDAEAIRDFLAAGFKLAGRDRTRLRAFFDLADPLAERLLAASGPGFLMYERELNAFARALWGRAFELRALTTPAGGVPRRTNLIGDMVRVPESFRGFEEGRQRALMFASVAHATAHLAFSGPRFEIGQLKPLQIALVSLIEDARVERLAARRFPGLGRAWRDFHEARPGGAVTAPALMARLARALADPAYDDGHGFVRKGRDLFRAASPRIADPAISREIGGLLGNDLGQMRVQFNARDYVVEPAYRDDNARLWRWPEDPHTPPETIEIETDAVRLERREAEGGAERDGDARAGSGRARAADAAAEILGTYPEWDREAGRERADWTIVRAVPATPAPPDRLRRALDAEPALSARIERLVRAARIGRHQRLRRQPQGTDLDLDAMLDAALALRRGELPDERVHRSSAARSRDLAISLLLDISQSTADPAPGTDGRIIDVMRVATALIAGASDRLGDPLAVNAFASNGREDIRFTPVKAFRAPFDHAALARLAGLKSGLSTRLGAALRHAGHEIQAERQHRRLVIVLTDGEPSDVDVAENRDLVEDARRAIRSLKAAGIDVFGVTLDPSGAGSGEAVFGRANHIAIRRLGDLPARLTDLYFRLARK